MPNQSKTSSITPSPYLVNNSIENSQSNLLRVNTLDDLSRLADLLAASKFFSDAKDAAQCAVKVLAGVELGLGAFQSMSGIHIIQGKPSVGAGLMASKLKASTKYDYETIVHSDEECTIAILESEIMPDIRNLKRKLASGELTPEQYIATVKHLAIGVSSFTLADAKRAGTQNMTKYPKNMLFARCISNGIKWYAPDLFCTSVYVPEELGAVVDEEGNVISYPQSVETSSIPAPVRKVIEPQRRLIEPSRDDPATVDSKEKGLMIALIGKLLVERDISRSDARAMLLDRYNKEKGAMLTLPEMRDFAEYIEQFPVNAAIADEGAYDDK